MRRPETGSLTPSVQALDTQRALVLSLPTLADEQHPDPLLPGLREGPQAAAQPPRVHPLAQRPSHLPELRRVMVKERPARQTALDAYALFHAATVTPGRALGHRRACRWCQLRQEPRGTEGPALGELQEQNLRYVALMRAKDALYLAGLP